MKEEHQRIQYELSPLRIEGIAASLEVSTMLWRRASTFFSVRSVQHLLARVQWFLFAGCWLGGWLAAGWLAGWPIRFVPQLTSNKMPATANQQ